MPCQWSCQPSCKMNLPSSTCFITGTKSKDAFFTITHAVWLNRRLDLGNMFTLLQQCQSQPSRCSARSAKQDKAPSRARSGAFLSDKGFNSSCTTCIRQSSWHVTRNLRNQAEALEIDQPAACRTVATVTLTVGHAYLIASVCHPTDYLWVGIRSSVDIAYPPGLETQWAAPVQVHPTLGTPKSVSWEHLRSKIAHE